MGLDSTMIFISSKKDSIKNLSDYFNELQSRRFTCNVIVSDVFDIRSTKGYFALKIQFRRTYDYMIIDQFVEDNKIGLLSDVYTLYWDCGGCIDDLCLLGIANGEITSYTAVKEFMSGVIYSVPELANVPMADLFTLLEE